MASVDGCIERAVVLLSDGLIDIDQVDPKGCTPLMLASYHGHSHVVRVLLNKRANVSIVGDGGITALHLSALQGHLAVSKMLVNAGADLEASDSAQVDTPLHLAAEDGQLGVMYVLLEAGANPNSRRSDGSTPLFMAAEGGQHNAIKMLLRAKANPLLATDPKSGRTHVPLDMAALKGHSEVVCELVHQVGIEGCGGASGGVDALRLAALGRHLSIMAVLTHAGVVDNGRALSASAAHGCELPIKFLLQQREGHGAAYVNYQDRLGRTPLLYALGFGGHSSPSPRIVRLLVDAGADDISPVPAANTEDDVIFNETPLVFTSRMLREKRIAGEDVMEEPLHRLEGIRRLLLRVEAVHAVSFLWPVLLPSIIGMAEGASRAMVTSIPLRMMLPVLRRRARRPRVLLAALWR